MKVGAGGYFLRSWLLAALIVWAAAGVWAQSTTDGAIGGTVTDPTGAAVANAKRELIHDHVEHCLAASDGAGAATLHELKQLTKYL